MRFAVLLTSCCLIATALTAQNAAPPTARYCRLIVLQHFVGSGKKDDPKRPEFVPATLGSRDGIIAWSMLTSDDGNYALVHLVAVNRKAFDPILNDKRPDIRVFEIGRDKKDDIEKELKTFKKDFDLEKFQVVAR